MKLDSNIDFTIYTKTNLGVKPKRGAKEGIIKDVDTERQGEALLLLDQCRGYWDSLYDFRKRRRRARRYYRGDQWKDYIEDPDEKNNYITEEEYIQRQGKIPLKQNMIRQLMKNLIGQYRSNPTKPIIIARAKEKAAETEMLTNALQAVHLINQGKEIDVRNFEEFLLGGAGLQKLTYKYFPTRNIEDVYFENVNPNRIIFNTDVEDIRLNDLRLVGEILDTNLDDIIAAFAKTKKDAEKIREWYGLRGSKKEVEYFTEGYQLGSDVLDSLNFFIPNDSRKYRLYEIWTIKSDWRIYAHDPVDGTYGIVPYTIDEINEVNEMRLKSGLTAGIPEDEIPLIEAVEKYESFWYGYYLTPYGQILWEGETPYKHEEHPYVMCLYPMIDGEVWGFVEDIIDQQRYINRLIILLDFIMSASAKGVLLIPEDSIPAGMTPDDFTDEWTKFNGVIIYKPSQTGRTPEQITSSSTVAGLHEILALQMKLLQEISGVHSAIQGMTPKSGTPASLYAQEAQNATLNTMDYLQTYSNFKSIRDNKILKLILQYYDQERYLMVSGRSYNEETKIYDPSRVQNIDFEVVTTQGTDTPVYRQLIDDTLMKLLEASQIDIELFLEHTSLPFADKLLDAIKKRKEELMSGQPLGDLPPELLQEGNNQADPRTMSMLNQAASIRRPIKNEEGGFPYSTSA